MKKNPQILLLIGAPGSGKSTFAKYFIRTEENWMRLCRDDIRTMNFSDSLLSQYEESLISEMLDTSIDTLLRKKYNVLLDATHCRADYLNHYINKFNSIADISFKVFECDVNELIARCEKRYAETGRYVPENVIRRFANELEALKQTFDFSPRPLKQTTYIADKQDVNLPKAIMCDLDGTLALTGNRDPYNASECDKDDLNEAVANVIKLFAKDGYNILLLSGREEIFREPTLRFLAKFSIPYHQLWMRKARDYRKDAIIKREIFDREISGKYRIEFVLDDRDQVVDMWRKDLKLNCFQVNYGNF
ncbi:MAG: zeta toxin family protein [Prevotellaceae bacterium]|jgi:predicted kinase|nr:zeta toxin family protein [Prevotellaceae bacterium]